MLANEKLTKKMDLIKGALYGFAIGDAMGATTEFHSKEEIDKRYGSVTDLIGGGVFELKPGQGTDDTNMTLCVMNAIETSRTNSEFRDTIEREFEHWLLTDGLGCGQCCYDGITKLLKGYKMENQDHVPKDKQSLGNGSLMRALPCALINNLSWNLIQGRVTHNNHICDQSIRLYHQSVVNLIEYGDHECLNRAFELLEPLGYITNTLNNAFWWSNKGSFEECIVGAVNDGGDADTIAAISGSLAGARWGFQAIPEKWILGLNNEVRTALDKFARYVMFEHCGK